MPGCRPAQSHEHGCHPTQSQPLSPTGTGTPRPEQPPAGAQPRAPGGVARPSSLPPREAHPRPAPHPALHPAGALPAHLLLTQSTAHPSADTREQASHTATYGCHAWDGLTRSGMTPAGTPPPCRGPCHRRGRRSHLLPPPVTVVISSRVKFCSNFYCFCFIY